MHYLRDVDIRSRVLSAAQAAGVEGPVRQARRWQYAATARVKGVVVAQSPTRRRNAIDERHLRVLLASHLSAESSCVDVGANVGSVLSMMCELAPRGQHRAYEAVPHLAERLRKT